MTAAPGPAALRGLGAAACLLAAVAACGDDPGPVRSVPGGDPAAGRRAVAAHGCGTCHVVPGVDGADGTVGPPLTAFARRSYIAGRAYNLPPKLVTWLLDPAAIDPATAMPDVGLSEAEARDVAAYLYTLR